MLQTLVDTPDIGRDEIVQLIKSEEVSAALQVLLNHFAGMVAHRVLNQLLPLLTTVKPVEEPAAAGTPIEATTEVVPQGKQGISEEVRKRISEAQKARWAKHPRTLSPEARAKISESQRKRWAIKNGVPYTPTTPRESSTEGDSQPYSEPVIHVESTPTVVTPKEAVLAVREGYKGDPFYISEDGHFIGVDGFVVPKDFEEFIDRFPKLIENWVRRRLSGQGVEEDIEDWCQDLMIHLKYLPPASKHRKAGKTDVFQTFDPFSQYGATERRWRNYINYCLANKYNTIHGKRSKNPVCRAGNLSLASETNPEVHGEVTDEYVYGKSEYLMTATTREEKKQEDTTFTRTFARYVQKQDPKVFPILMAVYEAGSSADTVKDYCRTCEQLATTMELRQGAHEGHDIGITAKEYNKARNRIRQLAVSFSKKQHKLMNS